jgi:hypothetical protein
MTKDDVLKLLCEVGFSGIRRNLSGDMDAIFQALRVVRPENTCGFIGQALLLARGGQVDQAIGVLEPALQSCSQAVNEAGQVQSMLKTLRQEVHSTR